MQVLTATKVSVRFKPGVGTRRDGKPSWWSGNVYSLDGRVVKASPSCQRWVGLPVEEFIHWAQCVGGVKCVTSTEEKI